MAKRGGALADLKIKPKGPLAAIVGDKPIARTQVTKKLWKYIDKHDLKGETDDGYTVKYTTKAGKKAVSKGGQVIHCGEDPKFKKFCGGKKRVSMMSLPGFVSKHSTKL